MVRIEAVRQFENSRSSLRDQLSNTIDLHNGDLVKARMAFEKLPSQWVLI